MYKFSARWYVMHTFLHKAFPGILHAIISNGLVFHVFKRIRSCSVFLVLIQWLKGSACCSMLSLPSLEVLAHTSKRKPFSKRHVHAHGWSRVEQAALDHKTQKTVHEIESNSNLLSHVGLVIQIR